MITAKKTTKLILILVPIAVSVLCIYNAGAIVLRNNPLDIISLDKISIDIEPADLKVTLGFPFHFENHGIFDLEQTNIFIVISNTTHSFSFQPIIIPRIVAGQVVNVNLSISFSLADIEAVANYTYFLHSVNRFQFRFEYGIFILPSWVSGDFNDIGGFDA